MDDDDTTTPMFHEPAAPAPAADVAPNSKRTRVRKPRPSRARGASTAPLTPADKPPRIRAPRAPRPRTSKAVDAEEYGRKLLPWYAIAGLVAPRVLGEEGELVARYAPMMAASWGPLCAENEAVRALVDKLSESSAVLGVVTAHVVVAGAVLAAKGKAPQELATFAEMMLAGDVGAQPQPTDPGGVPAQDAPPVQPPHAPAFA